VLKYLNVRYLNTNKKITGTVPVIFFCVWKNLVTLYSYPKLPESTHQNATFVCINLCLFYYFMTFQVFMLSTGIRNIFNFEPSPLDWYLVKAIVS
jgi:hypothetical protein